MREYATVRALVRGEVVELGGLRFRRREGDIGPGDLYIAERNSGPELLTCARVAAEGFVLATTVAYPYDLGECVRVEEAP